MENTAFTFIMALCIKVSYQTCPFESLGPLNVEILHQWINVDFVFPPWFPRELAIEKGLFIPENNILESLEVVNGEIFTTIRRGSPSSNRDASGVPSTLNRVVRIMGVSLLQPYPSLEDQTIGNCQALQNVGGLRIDRKTGNLWVVDTGTVNRKPVCPAKLVVIDTNTGTFIRRFEFPDDVFSQRTGFLTTIELDQTDGRVRYAYIGDVLDYKLIVYDFDRNTAWSFEHPSMVFETCGSRRVSGNRILRSRGGISLSGLSPDSSTLYYRPIAGFTSYQIPTFALKDQNINFSNFFRSVGEFPFQTFNAAFGRNCTFVSEAGTNTLKAWDREADIRNFGSERFVQVETLRNVLRSEEILPFANALSLDSGFLYFKSTNLAANRGNMDTSQQPNFIIGRIFVDES